MVQNSSPPVERIPTLTRLQKANLARLHADVAALAAHRQPVALQTGFKDWRCILHCHSYLSHDSRGKIEDIAAAAKEDGITAIFMSDHPQKLDVVAAGKHGIVDGVLFVPGSEANGFLVYPGEDRLPRLDVGDQALIDSVRATGGMIFVAHPEEHTDWSLRGLTGMEIYNTHADLNDETELLHALQPKDMVGYARLLQMFNAIKDYPREVFACIFDRPAGNLAHYDTLSRDRIVTAIAANDSHQNTGFVVYGTEDGKYRARRRARRDDQDFWTLPNSAFCKGFSARRSPERNSIAVNSTRYPQSASATSARTFSRRSAPRQH